MQAEETLPEFDLALLHQSKTLGQNGDAVVIAVPGAMVKGIIEAKYTDSLMKSFSEVLAKPIENLIITVDESLAWQDTQPAATPAPPAPPTQPNPPAEGNPTDGSVSTSVATGSTVSSETPGETVTTVTAATSQPATPPLTGTVQIDRNTGLNPQYTFDTFVIGSSNSFTAAAAESVVVSPAQAYNPLFIYGGSGLGKTHLLHAIGNYALELYPESKVRYVSSEEFTNEFINAIANQSFPEFQANYREVDFLLIDDIQFLQGKEQTLEEFFHTFNTLHTARKQVVITSDVPPKELKSFAERIKSRLEWGLMTDIQPPNLETRIAILRRKSAQEKLEVFDDVLEYIASNISSNIRELEGALVRITAYASLTGNSVSLDTAKEILRDFITSKNSREITPKMIVDETAKYFGLQSEDIMSTDRSRTVVNSRQIAMYLCRELTELSLPKVGEAFGGRDHTTVMHAVKKITNSMNEDSTTYQSVTEITNQIRRAAREA
ncbi:MAG: chromosomal replication initiator protein DnaA [Mobiluncus porci]|uniref:chromosomal replication initiator protein DnaA n=1 Tax=Mobiluncus TaxID=2050 RepID=UPI0023F44317|nr:MULTISPECIES: chromosomal replication initiator protein DnaA [Mobiluncus]MCI6583553.1 chromosomal replication initiator protein DnaA [Mobiluncus sp.]MDD7540931.1 chromosomal replication initiator protein DnaA [Mobiluncus porci]MDY5748960.1 chromosomal replication initiator protein DnaA [Mobiluncus porci]